MLLMMIGTGAYAQELSVDKLYCDNREDPTGIDVRNVRFGWVLLADAKQKNVMQQAYQLVMASSRRQLDAGTYDVYNSGKQLSAASVLVPYKGPVLKEGQTYFYKVKVWDNHGHVSAWSRSAQLITATGNWKNAKWIGYEELPDSMRVVPGIHAPGRGKMGHKVQQRAVAPLFRKKFVLQKPVKNALLFITGLGHYHLDINGSEQRGFFLAPGWTHYDKTVLYNTYDVTQKLQGGNNAIGVTVGNGFYYISQERYVKIVDAFGFPKMICRLQVTYEDGSTEDIVSDESWKTSPSPITFNSIYGGEDYDARLEQPNWTFPYFDDSQWKAAIVVKAPAGKLLPETDHPVKLMDHKGVQKILEPAPGVYVYDMGQNLSGIVSIKVKGKKGQVIKLTPAELLDEKQLANQRASGGPYTFSYTLKGEGEEVWQPQFTYYGFRYVQVEGAVPDNAGVNTDSARLLFIEALHNRNSTSVSGGFTCSNPLFNKIYDLVNWAIKSNMQSVLTDCPHREKLGWLEQDYLMGSAVHYNFDIYHLYRKLVYDLIDAQYPEGFVPDIAPEYVVFAGGFLDSPEWGSASVILPWLLYKWYGDKDILHTAWPMMQKYVAYLGTKANHHILSHGLGDWFDYGPRQPGEAQLTPKKLTATAIYYYDVALLQKMAAVLGKPEEGKKYAALGEEIKRAFNDQFFNTATKVYATGSQTAMAMPLNVGLVAEKDRAAVLKNLVDSINANNKALTAGDIGFNFLVKALDEGGQSQLVFDMNNRDDVPGYGFQLKKGATALTESWPALENVSNNHLMLGHIMEWLYSGLAGISQEDHSVSYNHIRIRPQPVGDITYTDGFFETPYGRTVNNWKKKKGEFEMQVLVPVNTRATVYVPATPSASLYIDGKKQLMQQKNGQFVVNTGSGSYTFLTK